MVKNTLNVEPKKSLNPMNRVYQPFVYVFWSEMLNHVPKIFVSENIYGNLPVNTHSGP